MQSKLNECETQNKEMAAEKIQKDLVTSNPTSLSPDVITKELAIIFESDSQEMPSTDNKKKVIDAAEIESPGSDGSNPSPIPKKPKGRNITITESIDEDNVNDVGVVIVDTVAEIPIDKEMIMTLQNNLRICETQNKETAVMIKSIYQKINDSDSEKEKLSKIFNQTLDECKTNFTKVKEDLETCRIEIRTLKVVTISPDFQSSSDEEMGTVSEKIPSPTVIIPSKHEENDFQYVIKAYEEHLLKNELQKINPEADREEVKEEQGPNNIVTENKIALLEEELMNATAKEIKLKELLIKTEENGTNSKSIKIKVLQETRKNRNKQKADLKEKYKALINQKEHREILEKSENEEYADCESQHITHDDNGQ